MFAAIKRLIGAPRAAGREADTLAAWARSEGHQFKRVKDGRGGGFVAEAAAGWRVEWGASQRPYISGHELRFRCDTGLQPDVQMMLLSKALAQTLETDVFSRYTNAMQTQVDHTLPEEMRWLAMHQRVSLAASPVLARRFALFCNAEEVAGTWLDDGMLSALDEAAANWWSDALLLVLTLNRGMLTLRMSGDGLEDTQLRLVAPLFERAAKRCRTVAKA